jgi:hypothetical protein
MDSSARMPPFPDNVRVQPRRAVCAVGWNDLLGGFPFYQFFVD